MIYSNYFTEGKKYNFILHEHNAIKAKLHYDWRIEIDNQNFIASLASRKTILLFENKLKKILLFPQPLHDKAWLNIRHKVIKNGYGAGTIDFVCNGYIEIIEVKKNDIKFNVIIKDYDPKRFKLNNNKEFICSFVNYNKNILCNRSSKESDQK